MNTVIGKKGIKTAVRWQRGMTIIELLVVMAVLGVLAAAIMPLGEAMLTAQKERELRLALWQIRDAIDEYKRAADRGTIASAVGGVGYPPSLEALAGGVAAASGSGGMGQGGSVQTVYFLRSIPRDPFADPKLPPEQTWRLRSYASSPDQPAAGADVFDIRSSSDKLALDGTPYAKW